MSDLVTAYSARLTRLVARAVADARAHAAGAVTAALTAEEDGRPTLRRAKRAEGLTRAQERLETLLSDLAGESDRSRAGLVRDAREDLYRAAYARWLPLIPAAYRARPGNMPPTDAQVARARAAVFHGMDLRTELAGPVATAQRRLTAAVVQAGARAADAGTRRDRLATWQAEAGRSLTRAALLSLSDAAVNLDREAGRDLLHPDLVDNSGPGVG
jgi:hypothetical protein